MNIRNTALLIIQFKFDLERWDLMFIRSKLPRCSPEEQGINSEFISNFIKEIEINEIRLRSFMFLRHGFVVAEGWWAPYSPDQSYMTFSISKSFTSTSVGFAISEKLFSIEDKVISFFKEEVPIIQKVTGETMVNYLEKRLFDPLDIKNYTWDTCPKGINKGGSGLNLRTEDIAKFGQLYLQKGLYNNQRILPEKWIIEATGCSTATEVKQEEYSCGYGYQFWRCTHNGYRAEGALGQHCIVMPDEDAV